MKSFWRDETGATAIEYGLIAGLVALAVIGGFVALGNSVVNLMGAGTGGAANVIADQAAKLN
jgi:pilus assembly protein Flp/PilA